MSRCRSTVLRLAETGLDWRETEDEVLALDHSTSEYLSANRTGAMLWRQLATGTTHEQLVELLTAEAGIDAARAERDIDVFLGQLAERGWLVEGARAAGRP